MSTPEFARDPLVDAEQVTRAVFKVLTHVISPGELADIQHMLPKEVNELWPPAASLA